MKLVRFFLSCAVRVRSLIALAVAAALVLAGLSPAAIAAPAASSATTLSKPVPPSTGLLLGDTVDGLTADQTMTAMQNRLGRNLPIARMYSRWDTAQPNADVTKQLGQNRLPLLSITPLMHDGTIVTWASIAHGDHDAEIRQQAIGLKGTGRPLLVSFHHEANLTTAYGTPREFISAFRHFVQVYRAAGATNVGFTLILTPAAYSQAATWYPGDSYVDWIGTDAYNFGACSPGRRGWQSLADAAQPFYSWASTTGKPLVLAEWGAPEDPADPTHRAQWMTDASATLAAWPAVKAAIYFDQTGSCNWHLGSSGPTMDAFATLARSALANGSVTARLGSNVGSGPAPLTVTLDASASTGAGSASGTGIASWTLDYGDGTTSSGSGQPTPQPHTYAAGTWTATLTVTDGAGNTDTDATTVVGSLPPKVGQGTVLPAGPGAVTLPSYILTNLLTGSYYVMWGLTKDNLSYRTADAPLAARSYTQGVTMQLTGLTAGVRYYWLAIATTSAGTGQGHVASFLA